MAQMAGIAVSNLVRFEQKGLISLKSLIALAMALGYICAFEYDKNWLVDGFSISPLELPLRQGLFIAKPQPFYGNFGIFEDSFPYGYGCYLLHKALLREGIDDSIYKPMKQTFIILLLRLAMQEFFFLVSLLCLAILFYICCF